MHSLPACAKNQSSACRGLCCQEEGSWFKPWVWAKVGRCFAGRRGPGTSAGVPLSKVRNPQNLRQASDSSRKEPCLLNFYFTLLYFTFTIVMFSSSMHGLHEYQIAMQKTQIWFHFWKVVLLVCLGEKIPPCPHLRKCLCLKVQHEWDHWIDIKEPPPPLLKSLAPHEEANWGRCKQAD